ncbi:SCO family protein [Ichthyobacterium seriolicida]|uniref:Photosynthetic protein synthase II n=1 Tax=Ichthyobacterium seriolicida TaxID=242600 RepID=A0A1J1E9N4_9FLAO|nr:SCO family protein [Ichthyobacterium seriolicida]BAV94619.1 photosynthetic protein synthase II [Ichthyobacterium seriolicida]
MKKLRFGLVIIILISLIWVIKELFIRRGKENSDMVVISDSSPSFSFLNQSGELVSSEDYKGKVYVVEFFFTSCPDICEKMNNNMLFVQNSFFGNADFRIVSFTVDPENDTEQVLREYGEKLGANTKIWNFLRGEKQDIYNLAQEFFISANEDKDSPGGFFHDGNFILIDKRGRIRSRFEDGNPKAVYSGTDKKDIYKLIDDIKVLLND